MSMLDSKYRSLPEIEKNRIRKNALSYYHRHKDDIRVKRKIERDTNPDYKVKRAKRKGSPKYRQTRRVYHLKTKYGLTIAQYENMFHQQNGKCAICLEKFEKMDAKHIHIDHNHINGQIRQLLCNGCNCALGNLNENITIFKRAVKYLTKWSKQ